MNTPVSEIKVNTPLTLPSGQVVKNRVFKSAMSEALGTIDNIPTSALAVLYGKWATSESGILVTGNVMIDSNALGEPGNVVIENEDHMGLLQDWAKAGTQHDTQLWMQINHPGKQVPKGLNNTSVSPSSVPFSKEMAAFFHTPRALTEEQIQDLIKRFATCAAIAKKAGFTGVQIHGAHGYLVSQFLSPRHNIRTDQWGGSLENRMRFVVEVYKAIRAAVGADFPIGIKLNSADFQKGGFSEDDSIVVIQTLADLGIDLVEVSGGTYEAPAMAKGPKDEMTKRAKGEVKESTLKREAYFIEFAEKVRHVKVPLVITGGFRTLEGMNDALASGNLDMVGLGRPLAVDAIYPKKIIEGIKTAKVQDRIKTGIKFLDKMALMEVIWYNRQMKRISKGLEPKANESGLAAFLKSMAHSVVNTSRSRRLRA